MKSKQNASESRRSEEAKLKAYWKRRLRLELKLDQMRELAQKHGGKCLSDSYVNSATKLLWECSKGHRWEATPNCIKSHKTWCPHCAGRPTRPKTIEDMRELAKRRGGRCLSDKYVNSTTKLLWECGEGHRWEATPASIEHGRTWCPHCYKLKLERARKG